MSVVWLGETACHDRELVGGKAAYLSRLAAEYRVPPGFCLTATAHGPARDARQGDDLAAAYRELATRSEAATPPVAVRSSALDEDGAAASFAGQHETYLNIAGVEAIADAILDQGQAGDNVGTLLRGIERVDVERGQVLAKPGSIKPHTKFRGQVYVLTTEEGGRHSPFFPGYRPQFYIRTTDVTGSVTLPEGTEMVMPGDNVELVVELITPIAIEDGLRFAIREGGKTVGAGVASSRRGVVVRTVDSGRGIRVEVKDKEGRVFRPHLSTVKPAR